MFAIVLVAVVAFRLFPSREVTVLSNGEAVQVNATFDPRSEGLAAASVGLAPGDRILFADGGRHSSVAVQRARDVRVDVDGRTLEFRTQATTVSGALASAGVDLLPGDLVYFDGQLTSGRGPLTSPALASRSPGSPGASTQHANLSIRRARPITVYVDTLRMELSSAAPTVEGVLRDLGMTVREGDLVRPGLAAPVSAGMTVRLGKARTITVRIDGKEQSLYTTAYTVADVLRLLNLDPGPDEILEPARESYVANGTTVIVGFNRTIEEDELTQIAPGVVYETDSSLPAGKIVVVSGTAGVRLTKYSVTYKNGEVVGRRQIGSSAVSQAPIPTRNIAGPRPVGAAARPTLNAPEYTGPYSRKLVVDSTWYNASHGDKVRNDPWYGRTAMGVQLDYGVCAVDPTVIPMWTKMWIPNYGLCVAADVGGAIKGAHIDLGYPESAGNPGWGRQTVEIYIID